MSSKKFLPFIIFVFALSFLALRQTRALTIEVNNQSSELLNYIKSKVNTGENQTRGNGQITTGDGSNETVITNIVNTNVINNCCGTPTPTLAPENPTPTTSAVTPTQSPDPTLTPTTPPEVKEQGGIGGPVEAIGGAQISLPPQGEILGLSDTASFPLTAILFYSIGVLCLGSGVKFLTSGHPALS